MDASVLEGDLGDVQEVAAGIFPKYFISGYFKQEAWARGEGAVTGIFGPNLTDSLSSFIT